MDRSSSSNLASNGAVKRGTRGFCGLYETVHDIIARKLLSDIEYFLHFEFK